MAFRQGPLCLMAMAALLVPSVQAFWRVSCAGVTGIGLIDPIVSPGKPSSHIHTIKGASGLAESTTVDNLLNSKCTSW